MPVPSGRADGPRPPAAGDGERGEPPPVGYALVRALARLLLGLFYQRIDVVGVEQVPPRGGLIVAANHHNSLVDAMLLLAFVPRRLRTLANAPLFGHPLVGPFLRLVGALPVHRRQEAGDDPARNAALFAATSETLRSGGAILIFPEGRTQPEPVLLELRTGAARMLLAAEEGGGPTPVTLLPVGLVFEQPGRFRDGRALVLVGEPVATRDLLPGTDVAPDQAVRTLTSRLADALRVRILEADDRRTLCLVRFTEDLWRAETAAARAHEAERVAWLQAAIRTHRVLSVREPLRLAALRSGIESLAGEMEHAGLQHAQLDRTYALGLVSRFALAEGFALLVGAPLALLGIACHLVPYQATAAVVRRLRRGEEEEATDKLFAGLILYPLAWSAEAWIVGAFAGGAALAVFLLALLPSGFFALAWHERLERVRREARAFLRRLRDPGLPRRLREERRRLAAELAAMARLVPEAWQ